VTLLALDGGVEAMFDAVPAAVAEAQERGATPNIFHAEFICAPVTGRVSCLPVKQTHTTTRLRHACHLQHYLCTHDTLILLLTISK